MSVGRGGRARGYCCSTADCIRHSQPWSFAGVYVVELLLMMMIKMMMILTSLARGKKSSPLSQLTRFLSSQEEEKKNRKTRTAIRSVRKVRFEVCCRSSRESKPPHHVMLHSSSSTTKKQDGGGELEKGDKTLDLCHFIQQPLLRVHSSTVKVSVLHILL